MQSGDYRNSIILVTSSLHLVSALGNVIHGTITSVEQLPIKTSLKGVILDSDLARQGCDS